MTATVTSLSLLQANPGEVAPLLPSPAHSFIYSSHEGLPLPHSLGLGVPCPLCYMSFFFFFFSCLFIIQFVFFSFFIPPGWGSVCPGAMLFWPRVVCGSTACRLAHLVVCVFPSSLGAGVWWRESSSGGVGLRCMGWGHGGVRVWPLLGGFSCKVYLQCLSKILL
jgi:hypothetical protein